MPGFVASVQTTLTVPLAFTHLYYISFLSGFAISAVVYCTLHLVFPASACKNFVERSPSASNLMAEFEDKWDGENFEFNPEYIGKDGTRATAREDNVDLE